MKSIYVAKKTCKYIWETASHTMEECESKIKTIIQLNERKDYIICLIEFKDAESYLLI